MKSFIAALTPTTIKRENVKAKRSASDEAYVTALKQQRMTTVELAEEFNVPVTTAMKALGRLEVALRVRRVGSEKSGGTRETVVWDVAPVPNDVYSMTQCDHVARALIKGSASTRKLASMLNINYYSTLAACKQLELAGVVVRDGIDRSKPKHPHIVWKLK